MVHYKQLGDGGDQENKAESEWSKGVWLGPAERNTETLIGTSKGVVRAHTVEKAHAVYEVGHKLHPGYERDSPETGSVQTRSAHPCTNPDGAGRERTNAFNQACEERGGAEVSILVER